jgi:hypothetical protein
MHAVPVSHPILIALDTRILISIPQTNPFPGAMTWALFDKLDGKWKQFVGVDISPKSVEFYNQKAATQFTPEEMHAVCTELSGQPGELSGQTFDVVVVRRLFLALIYPILMSSSLFVLLSQSARKPITTLRM